MHLRKSFKSSVVLPTLVGVCCFTTAGCGKTPHVTPQRGVPTPNSVGTKKLPGTKNFDAIVQELNVSEGVTERSQSGGSKLIVISPEQHGDGVLTAQRDRFVRIDANICKFQAFGIEGLHSLHGSPENIAEEKWYQSLISIDEKKVSPSINLPFLDLPPGVDPEYQKLFEDPYFKNNGIKIFGLETEKSFRMYAITQVALSLYSSVREIYDSNADKEGKLVVQDQSGSARFLLQFFAFQKRVHEEGYKDFPNLTLNDLRKSGSGGKTEYVIDAGVMSYIENDLGMKLFRFAQEVDRTQRNVEWQKSIQHILNDDKITNIMVRGGRAHWEREFGPVPQDNFPKSGWVLLQPIGVQPIPSK